MKQASVQRRIFTFYSILMVTISAIIVGITYNIYTDIVIEKIGQSRVDVLKQITERTTTVKNTMLHVSNTFYTNAEILSYILHSKWNITQGVQMKQKVSFDLSGFLCFSIKFSKPSRRILEEVAPQKV